MPGAAEAGLQEPEHELAVVQQVQKGSISSAGTKAQLTVKLPGVSSADDVQVRCTISSVSVAVPGRYWLHLFLPFCIKDEAESVKFSGKKQPPTLTVTLAVESSLTPPVPPLMPAAPQSAAARAFSQSSTGSQGMRQHQGHQQQQQSAAAANRSSSSSMPASNSGDEEFDSQRCIAPRGPMEGNDRSTWLLPYSLAADWMDSSGAGAALHSMVWMLSPFSPPLLDEPDELLPLTLRNVVLALLTGLLVLFMGLSAIAYALGYSIPQNVIYLFVLIAAEPHLTAAYITYTSALNRNNGFAATLVKLLQSWQAYYWLWQLLELLRVNVVLSWCWRYVLWPVLLGQFWQPCVIITVPQFLLGGWVLNRYDPKDDPLLNFILYYDVTQLVILFQGGGWQTVASLLLAASLALPRLPKHILWPYCQWGAALAVASFVLAPAWPQRWQRWLAGMGLAWYVVGRIMALKRERQGASGRAGGRGRRGVEAAGGGGGPGAGGGGGKRQGAGGGGSRVPSEAPGALLGWLVLQDACEGMLCGTAAAQLRLLRPAGLL